MSELNNKGVKVIDHRDKDIHGITKVSSIAMIVGAKVDLSKFTEYLFGDEVNDSYFHIKQALLRHAIGDVSILSIDYINDYIAVGYYDIHGYDTTCLLNDSTLLKSLKGDKE